MFINNQNIRNLEGIKQQAKISPRIVFGKNLKGADLQIG